MHLTKKIFPFVFLIASLFSAHIFAKDVVKKARKGDSASKYQLDKKGNLYRFVGKRKLQVTNKVEDFKISHHPNDAARIYFIRGGSLYSFNEKTKKNEILKSVAKKGKKYRYNVVSNSKTAIVNVAMTKKGKFVAWNNKNVALSLKGVRNYTMNNNFGVKKKPFSSYVAFVLNFKGHVLKVKGKNPSGSKWDSSRKYKSLKEFKKANRIK